MDPNPESRPRPRARMLVAALALGALAAGAWGAWTALRARPPERPSVILVVLDTTRGDRCSVNGYARPTTPRLAEFARDAVTFRDAWTPGSWTAPSHATLFTGLRPENHQLDVDELLVLRPEFDTLAEILRAAGYRTACWSNNVVVGEGCGLTQGFDVVHPMHAAADRPYPWAPATHEAAAEWAIARHRAGEPFFLFVNDMEPHAPYTPPADVAERFVPAGADPRDVAAARALDFPATLGAMVGRVDVPPAVRSLASDLYDGEIAALDDALGTFLRRLDRSGVLGDAVVVVCGDHGENLGDHGLWEHRYSAHRSILHVPLVVRIPGVLDGSRDGGRVVDDVVRLEDVFPTVLDACGVPRPARALDGLPLTGDVAGRIARGRQGAPGRDLDRVREAFPGADTARFAPAVRSAYDGRHHLLAWDDGRTELYDVRSDPGETRDLAASMPDVVARLRAQLPAR